MRVAIVGALAVLGMTLTSTAVWSMTAPEQRDGARSSSLSERDDPVGDTTGDDDPKPKDPPPAKLVDKSTFVAGKRMHG